MKRLKRYLKNMKKNRSSIKTKRGFTLVELMVVLVVLGGLMTILLVSLSGSGVNEKAAKLHMRASKAQLELALLNFQSDFGRYPSTDEGLSALVTAPAGIDSSQFPPRGYIEKKFILDPWKRQYQYNVDSGSYEIKSLGADGQEGGEGPNADIDLMNLD